MSKVIVITGTSSGIGKTCAEYLAQQGHTVIGLSRKPKADEVRRFTAVPCDVTDVPTLQKTIEGILKDHQRIDVLINCAGMGISGPIEETSMDLARQQMEINFWGSVNCIQAVLPIMRSRKDGLIITVSSIGGLMGLPYQGFYSASKFALEGLTEVLRMELKGSGIRTALVNPGDFQTEFTARRQKIETSQRPDSPYYEQFKKSITQIEKDENGGQNPIMIAKLMEKLINKKNPAVRYLTGAFEQKLAVFIKRILPSKIFESILGSHYQI
jgi:short-subunit dehydrogenase